MRRFALLAGSVVLATGVTVASFASTTKTETRWVLAQVGTLAWRLSVAAVVFALSLTPAGFLVDSQSERGDPSAAGVIDSDASWSPDSRLLAFDRSDYGSPGDTRSGTSDVFVASADGRALRRLTQTPYNETVLGGSRIRYGSCTRATRSRTAPPTSMRST